MKRVKNCVTNQVFQQKKNRINEILVITKDRKSSDINGDSVSKHAAMLFFIKVRTEV